MAYRAGRKTKTEGTGIKAMYLKLVLVLATIRDLVSGADVILYEISAIFRR